MPLLPASIIDPLWVEFAALIAVDEHLTSVTSVGFGAAQCTELRFCVVAEAV